jgi:hypothetical protein
MPRLARLRDLLIKLNSAGMPYPPLGTLMAMQIDNMSGVELLRLNLTKTRRRSIRIWRATRARSPREVYESCPFSGCFSDSMLGQGNELLRALMEMSDSRVQFESCSLFASALRRTYEKPELCRRSPLVESQFRRVQPTTCESL